MPRKRRYSRLPFRTASTLALDNGGTAGPPVPTELVDISLKGALVVRPSGLEAPPGTPAILSVHLTDSPERIVMQVRVAHVTGERLGLQCVSIDMDSMIHLRRMMELNLGDPALLERELLALG
jgi:hypothetical protein